MYVRCYRGHQYLQYMCINWKKKTGVNASDNQEKNIVFFESLIIAVVRVMKILPKGFGEPETVINSVMLNLSLDKKFCPRHIRSRRILILTLRVLMSYIYGAPILDVSRSHTTTQQSR